MKTTTIRIEEVSKTMNGISNIMRMRILGWKIMNVNSMSNNSDEQHCMTALCHYSCKGCKHKISYKLRVLDFYEQMHQMIYSYLQLFISGVLYFNLTPVFGKYKNTKFSFCNPEILRWLEIGFHLVSATREEHLLATINFFPKVQEICRAFHDSSVHKKKHFIQFTIHRSSAFEKQTFLTSRSLLLGREHKKMPL